MTSIGARTLIFATATALAIVVGVHGLLGVGTVGFAVVLAVIAAVYPGALLSAAPSRGVIWAELGAASATFAFVVLGLVAHPLWLVPGYVFHAGWDWWHHAGGLSVRVVNWYPPFCAIVDALTGAAILVLWWLA